MTPKEEADRQAQALAGLVASACYACWNKGLEAETDEEEDAYFAAAQAGVEFRPNAMHGFADQYQRLTGLKVFDVSPKDPKMLDFIPPLLRIEVRPEYMQSIFSSVFAMKRAVLAELKRQLEADEAEAEGAETSEDGSIGEPS